MFPSNSRTSRFHDLIRDFFWVTLMIHRRAWLGWGMWIALAACAMARADDAASTPANDPHPTLITLHVANAPLSDIIAKIAQQTGMPVSLGMGNPAPPLSLDADQQPFWNVLEDLCKRSNSSIMPNWNGNAGPTIAPMSEQGNQRAISGPILLVFQNIQHLNQLTAAPDRQDFCEISGSAMWEPRLKVIFTDAWTIPTTAVDENGVSLVPDDAAAANDPRGFDRQENITGSFSVGQRFNGNQNAFSRELHVRLHVPPTAGRRIKTLTGKWRMFVAGQSQHFDIPNLAASKRQTTYELGDLASLTLQFAQANDQGVQLQFTIPNEAGGTKSLSTEMAQRNCLLQSMHVRVLDADGHPWGDTSGDFNNGQINVGGGGNQMFISVFIQRGASAKGKPFKAVVEAPVAATEIDAPFTLHDLPLP
jgi:hypothetical protein